MGSSLKNGNTKSCGCLKRAHDTRKIDDLSNQVFKNLVVLYRDKSSSGYGKHAKWICECKICGNKKSIRGSDLRNGSIFDCGCLRHNRISDSITVDMIGNRYGHLIVLCRDESIGHMSGQHAKWICKCEICGKTESVQGTYLRSGIKDRCHSCCKKSLGEVKISEILKAHEIEFVCDKPFLDCKNTNTGSHLRFDFRVTDSNTNKQYIIEYDGLQHYKPAPMWDDNGGLEERLRRDAIKNDWCRANNIPIIRMPYTRYRNLCIDDLMLESSNFLVT